MEGRKTYLIEFTTGELETIIWGLECYEAYHEDYSYASLRKELEHKLKSK